ncbi:homocysteine S-methyltransferase family protein, partial [Faecalibacillus intestinalis]|uniref:homocysteine S-methyltransferase family protein n=1 Tax=Faecalibacillus intestinalis TaxID=1982626 RepID=UPI003AB23B02
MLRERLNKDLLIFDGGFGSQLQELGMKAGEIPEYYNIEHPKIIIDIHHRYLKAGADFITTNTFGANPLKLEQHKYSYQEVILAAIQNAKEAKKIKPDAYIALDIGPIGKLMEPMGTLTFDEVYQSVKQMVELVKEDIDVVLFETMTDIYELKASILAVKECSDLPVFATMTFETNGRSLSGCDPLTMVNVLEGLKVDALGINCSLGPNEMAPIIENILESTSFPVMIQPNAGLPLLEDGQTVYPMKVDEFIEAIVPLVKKGIAIVGGCCGTTPEFIQKLKENCPTTVTPREVSSLTRVSSGTTTVEFGKHVVVCGERLNPTGKKKLKAALKEERYDELVVEAIKQEQAGAHVLDVNVGLPGIDEPKVMKHVIKLLQEVIQLPLQIDSSNFQAIEEACRYYNGKPLINSVNGKDETMEAVFPVVKKYGGVVIGLALDENGIPPKAEQRFEIAKKIINKAKEYGIDKKDIIIDCLVLTASAQQKEVMETIKAVSMVKTLGVHTVLGVSNVSFGLPNRPLLNKTFLAMAMSAGLDLPIINPLDQELMNTIDAFNVLYNYDQDATNYIQKQAQSQVVLPKQTTSL